MKILLSFLLSLIPIITYGLELKGTAKSLDTDKVLYVENHSITLDKERFYKSIESNYYDLKGDLIAQMKSDFSGNLMVPNIQFEDFRFKKKESLSFINDKEVQFSIEKEGEAKKTKTIKYSENMVAGQGFDNFIKKNFNTLQNQNVPLNFGVLSSMSFYQFKGYSIAKKEESDLVKFGISLSNPVFRVFVKKLVIEYDKTTKVIKNYKGLSNLSDLKGKGQSVNIEYEIINE
ncbi:MAG: hypothetical protein M9899_04505 [Bdellovibrionaceae bacterium]|nr:hypothetical protein [Pseudobdellovibrionaceae bacterium]